jgi:hypothetical protein
MDRSWLKARVELYCYLEGFAMRKFVIYRQFTY